VIFNSDLGQWGAYNYNADKNVLEIEAEVSLLDITYEPFTIEFQLQDDEANLLDDVGQDTGFLHHWLSRLRQLFRKLNQHK
jgi:hypothetical protein